VVRHWGGGSDARKNKSASPLLPHWRRPSWWHLGGDGNVCYSVLSIGSLVFSPFFRSCEIYFSVCRWPTLVARARWFLWSEDVGPEVGDLSFFLDFIDGRRRVLVQDSTGTSPDRRAIATCGLFIDSQSLIGDCAFLYLAMVEARRFFRRAPLRRLELGGGRWLRWLQETLEIDLYF
jgi:hypothetical protein